VVGSVNFYGTTANAFAGDKEELARLFGAWVEDAVRNADLSMSSVHQARSAPALLAEREVVDRAVGALASSRDISTTEARERLADAALRAGTTEVELARAVVLGLDV
jgi:AmiR/NasT family two-component response regulator